MTRIRLLPTLALLAALAAGAVGCSGTASNADPRPVNVKEDPRLKRSGAESSGSENSAGQLGK
jgi:hypothetical protein